MLFLTLIIILMIQYTFAAVIHNCRNGNVYLRFNEIAFYETPNFPANINGDIVNECNLTFILLNSTATTTKMFTSYIYAADIAYYEFLATNKSSFKLQDILFDYPIKGIVIFEKNDESCPLESISRNTPFKINHENEVLYIFSNYYENKIRKHSCLWRFEAPQEYGFKVVIREFVVSNQTFLRIRNSTDLLINERSINLNYPHYMIDNYLEIYLSKGDPNFITDIEFKAYISIVKKELKKKVIDCSISNKNNVIYWGTFNNSSNIVGSGYPDGIQCSYNFSVSKDYAVDVVISSLNIEENGDIISYSIDGNNEIIVNLNPKNHHNEYASFAFVAYKNGSEKHVTWKFISDGSINLRGFIIQFQMYFCQCKSRFVECGSINYLMNYTTDQSYYCGNLECSITLGSCSSKLTSISLNFGTRRQNYDTFRIISNNEIVLDINQQEYYNFEVFLNSNNLNIFEIITYSSPVINTLYFSTGPVEDPIFGPKMVLSEDNTFGILNNPTGVYTSIEMTKSMLQQNVFYILYCLDSEAITLYNNKSLTKSLDNCFIESALFKCVIKESTFVLYQLNIVVSAIELSTGSKNCIFQNSIFLAKYFAEKNITFFPISSLSSNEGTCFLTVLTGGGYYFISHLWTTSKKENVKIFVGNDQTKLFFEFNSKTEKKYKNILLTSAIYTIVVPKSTSLYIGLKYLEQDFLIPPSYPYLSLFTTPQYGCFKDSTLMDFLRIIYHIKENPIKFTVLNYTYSEDNLVWYTIGDEDFPEQIFINKTGDFVIFKNQTVTWWCMDATGIAENGAMFLIETYNINNNII